MELYIPHSFIHWLIHSLTHSLTRLLTSSLTHSLTNSLTHLLTHSHTHTHTHRSMWLYYDLSLEILANSWPISHYICMYSVDSYDREKNFKFTCSFYLLNNQHHVLTVKVFTSIYRCHCNSVFMQFQESCTHIIRHS